MTAAPALSRRALPRLLALGVAACIAILLLAHANHILTLLSLRRVDQRPLYVMRFYGDYGFAKFLKEGARSDRELEDKVIKRLMLGKAPQTPSSGFACTVFSARTPGGQRLVGRNFDHPYTPVLLLYTKPRDGYASLSVVDLAYAGYSRKNLPTSSPISLFRLLAMPYVPFDGMNEAGLSMALLAVPSAAPPPLPGRPTLNTTTAIRLVLDHAGTVAEAVALLRRYNFYFSGGVEVHYLIADRSGDSAVVEFVGGRMEVVREDHPWQVVTNFVLSDPTHPGDGQDRYATATRLLSASSGRVTPARAMQVLKAAVLPGKTQWSAVYGLSDGTLNLALGADYTRVHTYSLNPTH